MGVSTDGQICYGILFEEGDAFPWEDEKFDGFDEWWETVSGFAPAFNPYNLDGEYKKGVEDGDPRVGAYHAEVTAWRKMNRPPVEIVNVCSNGCPQYLLAIPGTFTHANRGFPIVIDKAKFDLIMMDQRDDLIRFCKQYGLVGLDDPKWYLSSYWSE